MAKRLDPREMVSIEEILISSMYEIEAPIEILTEKSIITKEELLDRIRQMKVRVRSFTAT